MTINTCEKCNKQNDISSKYCVQCGYEIPKQEITPKEEAVTNKTSSKINVKKSITGIVIFALTYFLVQTFFSQKTFDQNLMIVASEINKSCPIMIDQDTRLDNTIAMPNNSFQYNYTLVNIFKSEINIKDLKKIIEPNVINIVKTNPDMSIFRHNQTTLHYYYKDKNGLFIMKISVTPEKYE